MAKFNFQLSNKNKEETKLYCNINYGLFSVENGKKKYLPLKYQTNITVIPSLWDNKNNRVKESIKWAEPETYSISKFAVEESAKKRYTKINDEIKQFELEASRIIDRLTINNRLPRHEQIRKELDRLYNPQRLIDSFETINFQLFNLVQFIEHIVETSAKLKHSTKKSYEVVKRNLVDYQKKHKGIVTPQNADIDFYNSFVKYLSGLGLAQNTIGTRIKIIKTVLNYANERISDVCQDYKKKAFAKPTEETENIYLNEKELTAIYNLSKLPKHLDNVRDMFLIGCYTGLRYSDLIRLTKDNITSDNTIRIKTQKTENIVDVPIHIRVKQIFEKHNYNLPKPISNQKYNEYIKDVVELAGINEPITRQYRKNGLLANVTVPKFKLVSSHTARRSFATNAFLSDMPTLSIMQITGHKTESAFMKYIKMSAKDNAIKLKSHKFFNPLTVAK